jgi:Phage integrase family
MMATTPGHISCITWVCQRYGERLLEIKRSWNQACKRLGLEGRLVHDFRRTAVRNMTRAGIPEKVAMAISGHKTRSVFDHYNIVNETDLKVAAKALATYYEQEKVTLSVTLAELRRQRSDSVNREPVETSAKSMEPAIRIERTTCGLRNRCSTN